MRDLLDEQLILIVDSSDKDTPVSPTPETEKIVQELTCMCKSKSVKHHGWVCPIHGVMLHVPED